MIRVVAAVILRQAPGGPRQVLAGRRTSPPALAGRWEFPGGKVEPGESDLTALRREIREELGVDLLVHGPLGGELPMIAGPGVWQPFVAEIASGVPTPVDHDQLRWLAAAELEHMRWLTSDVPVLALVRRLLEVGPAGPEPGPAGASAGT